MYRRYVVRITTIFCSVLPSWCTVVLRYFCCITHSEMVSPDLSTPRPTLQQTPQPKPPPLTSQSLVFFNFFPRDPFVAIESIFLFNLDNCHHDVTPTKLMITVAPQKGICLYGSTAKYSLDSNRLWFLTNHLLSTPSLPTQNSHQKFNLTPSYKQTDRRQTERQILIFMWFFLENVFKVIGTL